MNFSSHTETVFLLLPPLVTTSTECPPLPPSFEISFTFSCPSFPLITFCFSLSPSLPSSSSLSLPPSFSSFFPPPFHHRKLFWRVDSWPALSDIGLIVLVVLSYVLSALLLLMLVRITPISILGNSKPLLFVIYSVFNAVFLVFEEAGWRSFALPRVLMVLPPFEAAVTIGVIWGIWHIPLFLFSGALKSKSGSFSEVAYKYWYWTGVYWWVSVFMTIMFYRTGGSLLAMIAVHSVFNCSFILFGIPFEERNEVFERLMQVMLIIGAVVAVILRPYVNALPFDPKTLL